MSMADDGCNIAVENFQTLCLFRVNRSCYIHPSGQPGYNCICNGKFSYFKPHQFIQDNICGNRMFNI